MSSEDIKIVHMKTQDIKEFKILMEILSGVTPEVIADFIRDVDEYSKKLDSKNNNDINDISDTISSDSNDNKSKKKKKKKERKNDIELSNDSINSDDEHENKGCIKILTSDPNQVMIIYIKLNGSSFLEFNVKPDIYSVGLNLDELHKYLKGVNTESVMNVHVDSDDTQHIVFNVSSENGSNESICELRVLNLTHKKDRKIETGVQMAVRINCGLFHKTCKELLQFSQYVEITCDPTKLVITCKGDLSNHSRTFRADNKHNSIAITTNVPDDDHEAPNIINLIFDLKYINTMYKCISLCDDMEIYLNSDSVMFLKYCINLKGEMYVGIAPSGQNKSIEDNYNDDYDEFYNDEEIHLR